VKERYDTAFFSRSSWYQTAKSLKPAIMLLVTTLTIPSVDETSGASSQASVEKRSTHPINIKVIGETNTMKKLIAIFVALSVVTILTAASCAGSAGGGAGPSVHMGETTFLQPSVTISKGSSLNLIDDVPVLHIIGNGSWVNNVTKPAIESGAPTVNNVQISSAGQSITVGPFNTGGTYHLYCSVHLNMNLTVIVQ
jgi:plastocyanin